MELTELYSMLEVRRRELGLSQADVGRIAFGKEDNAPLQSIRRGASPSIDRLRSLGDALGFELYFGPPREETSLIKAREDGWSEKLMPHLGLAKCSVSGWADDFRERDPMPRPSWIDDESAFWVMATGQSMELDGIISGDYCLISPARQPRLGDRVFIKDALDKVAIKRLMDMDGQTAKLRGWQPIRDGQQAEFKEERPLKMVKELFPIVAVYRGKPGNEKQEALFIPDPRAPELPRHDGMVLVEVLLDSLVEGRPHGMPTTLGFHQQWLQSIGLLPENAALVGVIDGDMQPTFDLRSIALINRALVLVSASAVYAIRRKDGVYLRRLESLPGKGLLIRGDHPASESEVLSADRAGEIEILGKVVWAGHHV